jgi:excisionase family DNA binding protein
MESIIQIHHLSKEELISIIENVFDEKYNSHRKKAEEIENLTVKQTATLLGVTELTVYNYIKKGFIPASKIGRRVLIKKTDVDQALSQVKSLKYRRDV